MTTHDEIVSIIVDSILDIEWDDPYAAPSYQTVEAAAERAASKIDARCGLSDDR